jgi:glycosyltransferase involved in cell wall biosynthesis
MTILHVINALSMGGAEKMLFDMTSRMNETKNYSVSILLLNDKQESLKNVFEDQGIKVYVLNCKSNYSLMNLYKIIKYMKKYDIIHSHLFPSNYWVALAKIFLKDKVIVTTEHNTHNKRREHKFFKPVEKFIYSKYNKVISISDTTQVNLLNWLSLVNNGKFIVIENGIDLIKFKTVKAYEKGVFFDDTSFILTMVGSLSEQKDQETIIRAMKFLPENAKLLLVGDGNKRNKLVRLINELELEDKVELLGVRQDIPSIMKTSDVVIVSSNWEGFGLVAVEGMASEKPVVASNVDGLKQVVEGFGVIFEKSDEEDLAKKILELMNNMNYYHDIAMKCYEHSKDYSIERLVEQYLKIYEDAFNNEKIRICSSHNNFHTKGNKC